MLSPSPSDTREFSLFLHALTTRSLAGHIPSREEILFLLGLEPESPELELLCRQADIMARKVTNGIGRIWSAVGIDRRLCSMSCDFCSFGEKWGLIDGDSEWSAEDVVQTVRCSVQGGASWVTLRTTEFYSTSRLIELTRQIRKAVPGKYALVVNTGELDLEKARSLHEAGVTGVYHTLRLGEGTNTRFDPEVRLQTLAAVRDSPLELYHMVEPLGPEHTNDDIADRLLIAHEYSASLSGVMARINVKGTPFEGSTPVSEARISQITAISRICGGTTIRDICVVPPSVRSLCSGANAVTVEVGAIPRSEHTEQRKAWNNFDVVQAGKLLRQAGYKMSPQPRQEARHG